MINIVIPMAGLGSRFVKAGYNKPKPFIDVMGEPMIVRVIENLAFDNARFILVARKEHLDSEIEIVSKIEKKFNAIFIPIQKLTEGTVCTVLHARKYINNSDGLIVANSDQIVDINLMDMVLDCRQRNLDGSILTFIDSYQDAKWSFARLNKSGLVCEVQEKKVISKYATVGIYYFTQGKYFVDASIDMIANNDRVNNEFYTCPTYNYILRENLKVGIFNIHVSQMHGIGTPEDLKKYICKDDVKSGIICAE